MDAQKLARPDGASIAYRALAGREPGVVFLHGYLSDMNGSKALALDAWARETGRAFLRFDYFGHGSSGGDFAEATIGRWADDAVAVLDALTSGPQILVGSSIGGWVMLLAALQRPSRICGLLGIAAAPDATEDLMWSGLDIEQRATLMRDGEIRTPSAYDPAGYRLTRRLIEDGRRHLLLRSGALPSCRTRLLHGLADADVPWQTSLRLAERLPGEDVRLDLVKGGDHRLSTERDLGHLRRTIAELAE